MVQNGQLSMPVILPRLAYRAGRATFPMPDYRWQREPHAVRAAQPSWRHEARVMVGQRFRAREYDAGDPYADVVVVGITEQGTPDPGVIRTAYVVAPRRGQRGGRAVELRGGVRARGQVA